MSQLQTTFRSTVNTWQCDENDHLNVQFFTAFADDASTHLLTLLGMGPAAQARVGLALEPRSDHIRYWKELRSEDAVEIVSAPIAVEPNRIVLYHEQRNGFDGEQVTADFRPCESRDLSALVLLLFAQVTDLLAW